MSYNPSERAADGELGFSCARIWYIFTLNGLDSGLDMAEAPGSSKPRLRTKKKAGRKMAVSGAPVRAFFDGDHERDVDSLAVRDQVSDFAKLITGRDVRLPLSLGLFGNWGVGKTHFMELLQTAVSHITDAQPDDDPESTYVRRTAQIKFNAWHFVDTNIWASMATTIFDGIAEEYAGDPNANYLAALRAAIHKELKSSEATILEFNERQRLALKERARASAALDRLQFERAAENSAFNLQRFKRLLQVKMPGGETVEEKLAANAISRAEQLGIERPLETVEDVRELEKQFTALQNSVNSLLAALGTRFTGWNNTTVTIAVASMFVVGAWGLGQLWDLIAGLRGLDSLVTSLAAVTTQVAVLTLPAIGWLGKKMTVAKDGLHFVRSLKEEWDKLPIDEKKDGPLLSKIQNLDAQIEQNRQLKQEAEERLRDAQARLQAINSGELVYDFVLERSADDIYQAELGIISIVRADFEKLKVLLDDWNLNAGTKIAQTLRTTDDSGRRAESDDEEKRIGDVVDAVTQKRPIERVILYIDDLDRCHPDKVVEVLQAVHLLLAFDLFVVVVAVDPRWLERSLYRTYAPESIGVSDNSDGWNRFSEFSPQNYLEKIFQIPFSLAAMSDTGYVKLIEHLVQSTRDSSDQEWPEPGRSSESSDRGIRPLEAHEKKFLQCLSPFVPTPRLAKRVVNIYRLLRVRAGNPAFGFDEFIDEENGEFRAALILLAMSTAYGRVASTLIHALGTGEVKGTWVRFMELADPSRDDANSTPWAKAMELDERADEFVAIKSALSAVRSNLKKEVQPGYPTDIEPYVKWAPEVSRYSFQWYLS